MKKAALFFLLAVMSGSVLTGCGSGSETVEKTEVTATPNPTKVPQKSGTSEKTPANENKSQGTSNEKMILRQVVLILQKRQKKILPGQ